MDKSIIYCHSFPGPGFAIRIPGEVKKEFCKILREADSIFTEKLKKSGFYSKVSQAFAVFLPIKSVGFKADARVYEYTIVLRSVNTENYMTATVSNLPFDFLSSVSQRILNEVSGVSRVLYDFSEKPPSTIEWE